MATTKVITDLTEFNPGNPDYVLNATNAVTVINSGGNQYNFNGVYGKFGLRIGTTVLTGVPSGHPIAVLNNGLTGITYTGTVNEGTLAVGGVTYTFYSGDVTITVTADFGVASYYCKIHGYMGGQDNLVSVYSEAGLRMPTGTAFSGTPAEGMMRNDTTQASEGSASTMQHYNGTDWKNFVNITPTISVNYLLLGGGGGGAAFGGGGGGGGLLSGFTDVGTDVPVDLEVGTTYDLTVGNCGLGEFTLGSTPYPTNGGDSIISKSGTDVLRALGGGTAAGYNLPVGDGGSGGGGAIAGSSGGQAGRIQGGNGTAGQGFDGGDGVWDTRGGGGGGAGEAGNTDGQGYGGDGKQNSITSSSIYYAGGGGGGAYNTASDVPGGQGGGGEGKAGITIGGMGTRNLGGGGGGGGGESGVGNGQGANGGLGTVVLRYATASVSSYSVGGELNTLADATFPATNEALYQFNGNTNDSSGNGNNISVTGSVTYTTGLYGQSAVLGSTTTNLSTGIAGAVAQTWSAWIKMPASLGSGYRVMNSLNSSGDGGQYIDYNSSNQLRIGDILGGASSSGVTVTTQLGTDWHHIVNVNNTTQNLMYLDGKLVATNSAATGTLQTGNTINFGKGPYGTAINGMEIDQSRIINSALSASDVTKLYNEGQVYETTFGTDTILQFTGGTGTITFS